MIAMISGGVASGKSELAERFAVSINQGSLAYLATMSAGDEEGRNRIAKHRKMREGKGFITFEHPYHLSQYQEEFKGFDTVLLECMSNLILNEMYIAGKSSLETMAVIMNDLNVLSTKVNNIIIVSSIIFSEYKGYDNFTEDYIQVLGKINSKIAASADVVIESVCSLPVIYKGKKEILQYENIF